MTRKGKVLAMKTIIKRTICMVLVAAMACTYSIATSTAKVKLKKPQVSTNQMGNFLAGKVSGKDSKSKKLKKTETVYIELAGDGKVENTTVSDILEVKGNKPVIDQSSLRSIKNLKGDEKFTDKNGKLVWENKGKDITYQGISETAPPIGVSISYYLDGKEISAKELEGKSGELQIQYKFKNNAKTEGHDFIPFIVLGGFILDDETFSNIQIDNGKAVDYDESKIVLGYAVPGLEEHIQDTLKGADDLLKKIDLSDGFTISADVKDCTMGMGLMVATSNLGSFNIKDSIDLSDVKNKIKQLQDGADQLVDGANQLSDGTSKLSSASSKIKNGTNTLTSGIKKVSNGVKKYHKGNKKFHNGLKTGLTSAKSGAKKLADGSDKLAKGAKDLDNGAKKLDKGASDVNTGTKQVSGGVDQILYGFEKKDGINDGSKALAKGAKDANDGVKQLVQMLQSTPSTLDDQINQIIAQVKQASGGAITTEAQLNSLIEGINSAVKNGKPLETVLSAQGLSVSTYYSLLQAYYSIQTIKSVKTSITNMISQHAEEISALTNGMQSLEDGSSSLKDGLNQAYLGLYALSKGASTLAKGTDDLKDGADSLSKGSGSIKSGADALNAGIIQLYSGVKVMTVELGSASPQLVTGSSKLKSAMEKVYAGSNKLSNGMIPFCNGIDTLGDGTDKLASGAAKLNNEGIKKITSILGGKTIDDVQDLLDAGSSYNSFSGITKDREGQVKFIYKTPEIGERE